MVKKSGRYYSVHRDNLGFAITNEHCGRLLDEAAKVEDFERAIILRDRRHEMEAAWRTNWRNAYALS